MGTDRWFNMSRPDIPAILATFQSKEHEVAAWLQCVLGVVQHDPVIQGLNPLIVRWRVKRADSLAEKILDRYHPEDRVITSQNLFREITDLAGVRIVFAHKKHVIRTTQHIEELQRAAHWRVIERRYYVWHPDEESQLMAEGGVPERKDSGYCSRHFILTRADNILDDEERPACELQIRTILEEAMWENDKILRHKKVLVPLAAQELTRISNLIETIDHMLSDAHERAAAVGP